MLCIDLYKTSADYIAVFKSIVPVNQTQLEDLDRSFPLVAYPESLFGRLPPACAGMTEHLLLLPFPRRQEVSKDSDPGYLRNTHRFG